MACCSACERGEACTGDACSVKPSDRAPGDTASAHPIVARARAITGSHPAFSPSRPGAHDHPHAGDKPSGSLPLPMRGDRDFAAARSPGRSSGGIGDLRTPADAQGYYPSAAELARMGLTRAQWDEQGPEERLFSAQLGAGAYQNPTNDVGGPTPPAAATAVAQARQASLSGDDAAFQAALESVPDSERGALLREHLRAQGASEAAITAGLFALGNQGLSGLVSWMNSDLQRDLERIRGSSATEQTRIREEQQTAREEIRARAQQYVAQYGAIPPVQTAQATSPALMVGVGLLGAAVLWMLVDRSKGSR